MSYKDTTNKVILDLYYKYGLNNTLKVAEQMLATQYRKDNKVGRADTHGELCESVLEIAIIDFMKRNKTKTKDWFYSKGMILKNPGKGLDYFTEVDMVIFTPHKFLVIECKSYAGVKVFTDICTVTRNTFVKDVYKQHKAHFEALDVNFSSSRHSTELASKYAPYKIGYFDFSVGKVIDKRKDKYKLIMPILNLKTIDEFLGTQLDKPPTFNINLVRKQVEIIDKYKKVNTRKHLKFVKGMN